MTRPVARFAGACLALALSSAPALAQQADAARPIPSFRELEAAGATIGEIRIVNQNVFDLDDPREDNALFRFANMVHVRTRPGVIRRSLLFNRGERVSAQRIEESERLLRENDYLYEVRIRPVAYRDGVVDIEVTTRDSWTLYPGVDFKRQGGVNSGGLRLTEKNLFGTGASIGLTRRSDVDRTGTEFSFAHRHLFGGWTAIEYSVADFSDGRNQAFSLGRPFYALDSRWAAGVSASTNKRIDSIYSGSTIIAQYRHQAEAGEIFGGFSRGLVNGWAQRYSLGVEYQNDTYRTDPALVAPARVPSDLELVAPFVRYELVEDDFEKFRNRDRIERTEYFALGFNARLQLGRAVTGLGSTRDLWLYSATVSDGVAFTPRHNLLGSAYARGRYGDGGGERQFAGAAAKYYHQQGARGLFFTSVSADTVFNGDPSDQLLLGGDNGLRGYPQRYQTGVRRALLSLEQRVYTDWYPFRLLRIGGAVFFDAGRAWGGANQNTANPGWLSDVGIGLRILSDRSASGHTFHFDLAFPLNPDTGIRSRQFLFKAKSSF